jgi:acetyl-CoA carboxylase/biotin carboxylase 1
MASGSSTPDVAPLVDPNIHKGLASHFFGLNSVHTAKPSKVKEFVASHGGHTVINKVSI